MFSPDQLFKGRNFYTSLFSIHYPFSSNEIKKYSKIIQWGGCTYSFFSSSSNQPIFCNVGLSFNKNIKWDDKLKASDSFTCNHFQASNFDKDQFPLSPQKEISKILECLMSAVINNPDPQNNHPELPDLQSWFDKDYFKTSKEEVQKYLEDYTHGYLYTSAILLSESFYNFVLTQILIRNKKFRVASFLDLLE